MGKKIGRAGLPKRVVKRRNEPAIGGADTKKRLPCTASEASTHSKGFA